MIGHAHIPWENFNLIQLKLNEAAGIVIRPTWIAIVGSPYVGSLGCNRNVAGRNLLPAGGPVSSDVASGIWSDRLVHGLLSGFGTNLGLAYLNFHVPFINRIREAGRYLVLFVIGVSFLSGFGYSLLPRIWGNTGTAVICASSLRRHLWPLL